jgi:hypothetical protein
MAKSKSKAKSRRGGRAARARRTAKRQALQEGALEAEAQRRLDELFSDAAPVEHSAELMLERLEAGPVPSGIARFFLVASSAERARTVAAEVARRAPGGATALTLAADVAFVLDDDAEQASVLLDRALELVGEPADRVTLASHLLGVGRVAQALELVEPVLLDAPEEPDAQAVGADALALAHARRETDDAPARCPCWSGRDWERCCAPVEGAALDRFGDRGALEGVGAALAAFLAREPLVAERVEGDIEEWLGPGEDEPELAALATMAAEHAWLMGDEDDGEEPGDPLDADAPLALLARDPATPQRHAPAAGRWLSHCRYGLWQVADPLPAPGVWVTEILTGERHYAALPHEHLAAVGRWSVLLGPLVAVDGIWRSAGALVVLRPSEADAAADTLERMTHELGAALSGGRIARRPQRSGPAPPYGVLVAGQEPESAEVGDLAGKIAGSALPALVAEVLEGRNAGPRICNTDGDALCVIRARLGVDAPAATARRLAAHADVEDEDGVLVWWGRALDTLERATMLAQVRSQHGDVPEEDGPQRWLRGRIHLRDDGFEVEVNSRERFERLVDLFRELGEEPRISRKSVFDPDRDLPQLRRGPQFPFAGSREANAAWCEGWPDQPLSALGGRTPRRAARREADLPRLEALLRELEHDADLMARRGLEVPDIGGLRRELQMPLEAWLG